MKRLFLNVSAAILGAAPGYATSLPCDTITPAALGLTDVTFTQVTTVPAGEESPVAQCRIRGQMAARTGVDGKDYALSFELSLPDNWNGDYVHQFNGGNDGEVKPARGALPAGTGTQSPLARGYAVVSSDAGHDGKANPDAGLAGGARFGFDFEARQMYGYKAVATLDPVARDIVEAAYGAEIDKSYGVGCSNGGRHAMVAATRMPEAFDGLLAGAPGFQLPKAAVQHALDVQALTSVTGDMATGFPRETLRVVADGILAACDGLDGLEDGIVADTAGCQAKFDIKTLQCSAGQNADCLSPAQTEALATIHAGTDTGGTPYYSDWSWDPAIAAPGWRFWKIESPIPPWGKKPIIAVMGASSLAQVFTTPPTPVAGSPDALETYLKTADLLQLVDKINATTPEFPESAMQVMAPLDVASPKLSAFNAAGGKLILFHGVGDPVFSVNDTADWYAKLNANTDGAADSFAKFYPIPGMTHCSGGLSTDGFDMFAELVSWVEDGSAPGAVKAIARQDSKDVPETLAGAERLLCPAPQVARYQGGDPRVAGSFACE